MRDLITRNMDETEEFDVMLCQIESDLEYYKKRLENDKANKKKDKKDLTEKEIKELMNPEEIEALIELIQATETDLATYKAEPFGPIITIGYMPAAKFTDFTHLFLAAQKDKLSTDIYDYQEMERFTEHHRQVCTWGVKGHSKWEGVKFETEIVKYRGKEYKVASADMIARYEENEWLHLIRAEIEIFNRLSEKKRKKLQSIAGEKANTSTVVNVSMKK